MYGCMGSGGEGAGYKRVSAYDVGQWKLIIYAQGNGAIHDGVAVAALLVAQNGTQNEHVGTLWIDLDGRVNVNQCRCHIFLGRKVT